MNEVKRPLLRFLNHPTVGVLIAALAAGMLLAPEVVKGRKPGMHGPKPGKLKAEYLAYLTPLARELMGEWAEAWHGDVSTLSRSNLEATREHLTEVVVFRAPTGQVVTGIDQTLALSSGGTVGFGNALFVVGVDGEASGAMAFQVGRFVLEIPGVPSGLTSGRFRVVFRQDWGDRRTRALVFAPPGA